MDYFRTKFDFSFGRFGFFFVWVNTHTDTHTQSQTAKRFTPAIVVDESNNKTTVNCIYQTPYSNRKFSVRPIYCRGLSAGDVDPISTRNRPSPPSPPFPPSTSLLPFPSPFLAPPCCRLFPSHHFPLPYSLSIPKSS